MSRQSRSSIHIARNVGEVQAVEASVCASIRVKICVSIIIGLMAVMVVALLPPWFEGLEAIL